ncbi:MTH865 family protein [Metallumcola ferriviriculae]|uniref:MTH865 family protein n=1 Tax=Metallumcola ferriviriculae TaxID=3039180 RepID=A0AAU0UPH5_9FIRM|nr:MTH865 family protein [Desulfitibacteraceae bacterium MK1]
MNTAEIIKKQIVGALAAAKFPINSPEELLQAFPQGTDTTCEAGDIKVTAGEAGKLLTTQDFPFTSAEHVAVTIVGRAGL